MMTYDLPDIEKKASAHSSIREFQAPSQLEDLFSTGKNNSGETFILAAEFPAGIACTV